MPHSFKDAMGRQWSIAITYGLCKRIKAEFADRKIDLLEPLLPPGSDPTKVQPVVGVGTLHAILQTDIVLFYDVLESVVRPQVVAAGVSIDGDDGFGCAMAGDHLFEAQQAFFAEWHDFFLSLHRDEIAAAMEKMTAWWTKAVAMMTARIASEEVEAAAGRNLSAAMNSASGKLLESLASIPPTEP